MICILLRIDLEFHSGIEIDKEKNKPVAYYKIIHPRIFQKLKNQGNEGLKDE